MKLAKDQAEKIASTLNYRHSNSTVIAVMQSAESREVLMVGSVNKEALVKTLTTGLLHLWSQTRNKIWLKGESSGNFQVVEEFAVDCDCDAVLFKVKSLGPICHTNNSSCFFRRCTTQSDY